MNIHLELKRLIDVKSKRDNITFTACQLAKALGMPRSMITKLTHADLSKRVNNPRIDTLMKIIDFFKADGFSITLEDLLGINTKDIPIKHQAVPASRSLIIPIYALDDPIKKLGDLPLNIFIPHNEAVAFRADKLIKPFFKTGSLFVVDQRADLEDDVLIAVKLPDQNQVVIKKYKINGKKVILESLDVQEKDTPLLPTSKVQILGVIVQINAQA